MNPEGISTPVTASVRCVIAATVVVLAVALVLIYNPTSPLAPLVTTLTLAALIGAYAVNVSAGIPWLTNAPEDADAIGLSTKAVEAAGLVFSMQLNNTRGGRCSLIHTEART